MKRTSAISKLLILTAIGAILMIAKAQAAPQTTATDSSAGAAIVAAAVIAVGIAAMPARKR